MGGGGRCLGAGWLWHARAWRLGMAPRAAPEQGCRPIYVWAGDRQDHVRGGSLSRAAKPDAPVMVLDCPRWDGCAPLVAGRAGAVNKARYEPVYIKVVHESIAIDIGPHSIAVRESGGVECGVRQREHESVDVKNVDQAIAVQVGAEARIRLTYGAGAAPCAVAGDANRKRAGRVWITACRHLHRTPIWPSILRHHRRRS